MSFSVCLLVHKGLTMSKKGKKEEDKPPPALGPGSMIRSLAAPLRRHLPREGKAVIIAFSTCGMKSMPIEVQRVNRATSPIVIEHVNSGTACQHV